MRWQKWRVELRETRLCILVTFKERYSNLSKQKGDSDILRNDEMPKRFN